MEELGMVALPKEVRGEGGFCLASKKPRGTPPSVARPLASASPASTPRRMLSRIFRPSASDINDDKYRCSETGYRVPLKCVWIKDGTEESSRNRTRRNLSLQEHASGVQRRLFTTISNYKWRALLAESSKLENEEESYITYRSCVPVDSNEKLSVLGFEVIMLVLLLISGSVVYMRQKRTAIMSGVAPMRVSKSSPRF
ncbi:hypothetical protein OPV22_000880 [Ensete ventricosum]|uniref:Ig-like domain-containing protein n=1 Tax=Ensete ventricosum TaxID=4639 RepID=A0AAV8RR71_ENSVE|nr:hypothetical protein OPV22_000880 [Ensete ventricosum]